MKQLLKLHLLKKAWFWKSDILKVKYKVWADSSCFLEAYLWDIFLPDTTTMTEQQVYPPQQNKYL